MVIYLNANGTIQQIYPEVLTQGSNSQSIVLLTNGISQGSAIAVTFRLPNGDTINGGLMITQDEFVLNDEYVNAYTYDLTKSITNYDGNLTIGFEVVGGGLSTQSYELTVPIIKSLTPVIPTQPSDDEWYAQILEAYNYILQEVQVDIPADIASAINAHDTSETAHAYIRGLISSLTLRVGTNEGDISDLKTLTSNHTTEINNLKSGTTVIPTYELKSNKINSWGNASATTYPSAKLVKDTISGIGSGKSFVFDTEQDFLDWLDGTYTRSDGVTPSSLVIGNAILIKEDDVADYWLSSESDPITIDNFTPYESKTSVSGYVPETRTIAGINLEDDITKSELKDALDVKFIVTDGKYIEDNTVKTSSGSIAQTGTTLAEDGGWVQPNAEGRGSVAFGRGTVAGGQEDWNNPDSANHDYAFASGKNAKAYGDSSFAANRGTKVTGANAAAFNESTEAQGKDSFACGYGSKAYSKGAFASGYYTEANGEYSFTANSGDTNGKYAFAAGEETRANAEAATSFGRSTQATGANSMATGHSTVASHTSSFAGGESTQTSKNNQTVVGQYNADDSDALFIVGTGSSSASRSNTFVVRDGELDGVFAVKTLRTLNAVNNMITAGVFSVSLSGDNTTIEGESYGELLVIPYKVATNPYSAQIFFPNGDSSTNKNNFWYRTCNGYVSGTTTPNWNAWVKVTPSDNKLDKVTTTSGDRRVYAINANGTQTVVPLDYSNTASAGRIPCRSSTGALMIENSTYNSPGQFTDGLQAINKNKLIERTTALTGSGAPTTSTVGFVGQVYLDTTNNNTYQCTEITSDGGTPPTYTYTWVKLIRATDIATLNTVGLVKANKAQGTSVDGNGNLAVEIANATEITQRNSQTKVIYTGNLNAAVKATLTDANRMTLDPTEQATAKSVLGITGQSNAVSYNAQTPSSAEQEQARTNIEAAQFSAYNYHNSLGSGANITDCTTLEQIVTLAINNPTTALVGNIGNDPGPQPLRTLLGFPNGWGNYVEVISTSYQKLGSTNMKVLELMAYDLYFNKTAKGYIYVNKDGSNNPVYNWSGWLGNDGSEVAWTGTLNSGFDATNAITLDLSKYKRARIYYKCYVNREIDSSSGPNLCVNGGVIELDLSRTGWVYAGAMLPYVKYNTVDSKNEIDQMSINVAYNTSSNALMANFTYKTGADTIVETSTSDYYAYKIEGVY